MSIAKGHQVTRDNLAGRKNVRTVVKVNRSDTEIDELPLRVKFQNIGHAFILGHTVNGVLGTPQLGVDGQQIVLGTVGLGSLDLARVVNNENTFRDYYRDTTFFDTTNTSATISTATFRVDFVSGETLQSEIIFTDGSKELVQGTFLTYGGTSTLSTSTALNLFLSPDSGSNWESVSLGTAHTFTNTGTALMFKVEAVATASIGSQDGDGYDAPLKISYTTRN